jgi:hypothetical protein
MAWPMIEWVLDTHYADLFHREPRLEKSVLVYDRCRVDADAADGGGRGALPAA